MLGFQVGLASAVVVADDAACSTIGTDMLKKGGSGVDAAIAALLCQGVVHMHTSGIGGSVSLPCRSIKIKLLTAFQTNFVHKD